MKLAWVWLSKHACCYQASSRAGAPLHSRITWLCAEGTFLLLWRPRPPASRWILPSTCQDFLVGSGISLVGSRLLEIPSWQRMTMHPGGDSDQHIPRRVVPLELIRRRALCWPVQRCDDLLLKLDETTAAQSLATARYDRLAFSLKMICGPLLIGIVLAVGSYAAMKTYPQALIPLPFITALGIGCVPLLLACCTHPR